MKTTALMIAFVLVTACGVAIDEDGEPVSESAQALSGNSTLKGNSKGAKGKCTFRVTSPQFDDGDALLAPYTCQDGAFGSGITPKLEWTKGPKGTKSYAIVLRDTSLSDPNLAYHWAAWNIPHHVRTLPEGIRGVDAEFPDPVPSPEGLKGGQQAQARGVGRYFAPCPAWVARKAIKCDWPEPHPAAAMDSYAFEVFAFADRELDVPAYDPAVNSNYVHQLDGLFTSLALDSAEIAFTADAVPGAISDNGPFNCANPPLAPEP